MKNKQQARRLKLINAGTLNAVQSNVTKFIDTYGDYLLDIEYSDLQGIKSHNSFDNTVNDLFIINVSFRFDYACIALMDQKLVTEILNEPIREREGWGNQQEDLAKDI